MIESTISVTDVLETYRDTVAGLIENHLSSVSHRLNETMRTLTVISTFFIPLTLISGVYGMNFGNNADSPLVMPELRMYFGYPMILLLMRSVAVGMLFFLKRKGWIFTRDRL
ncbi:MAG: CorA family divalent cation transporter [Halothiobacillus sp.]